ncbi:P2Y purinoceptor 4-like [Alosa sapidissima]|uniref:P2Y purinoceptor 4-like n=1 Tax=Alosa sapidissima TaxID=34773 RepID=UPI001C0A1202|nr:P2Y purinoceptor 4-like [Alosa sapidissima]
MQVSTSHTRLAQGEFAGIGCEVMERGALSLNDTSVMNKTEEFDPFCVELFVGPLVWGILSVPCACVGLPASLRLLWALIQRQRRGLSNDVYMLNLTIMDLIFNIILIPGVINYFVWQDYATWRITDFFYCLSLSGRPLFMACICVDSYIAVVHPVVYMKTKHSKYRLVASALVWNLTLAFGVLFIHSVEPLFSITTLIFFTLCLTTITFCDGAIFLALRKPDPSGRSDVHPQKQRALQTITNSLVMALVSYLPPMVVFGFAHLIQQVVPVQMMFCTIVAVAYIGTTFGSAALPLLYLGNLGIFKDLTTLSFGCVKRA